MVEPIDSGFKALRLKTYPDRDATDEAVRELNELRSTLNAQVALLRAWMDELER